MLTLNIPEFSRDKDYTFVSLKATVSEVTKSAGFEMSEQSWPYAYGGANGKAKVLLTNNVSVAEYINSRKAVQSKNVTIRFAVTLHPSVSVRQEPPPVSEKKDKLPPKKGRKRKNEQVDSEDDLHFLCSLCELSDQSYFCRMMPTLSQAQLVCAKDTARSCTRYTHRQPKRFTRTLLTSGSTT